MAYVIKENGFNVATAADVTNLTGFIQNKTGLPSSTISTLVRSVIKGGMITIPTKTSIMVLIKE